MAFTEKIRLLIDIDSAGSTSSLGKLRTELGNADGAFAKMKAASSSAWDGIKAHAAEGALAAGAALVGFAVKAVGDFQDVALGAGRLRDALGLTAEEASRLQEVAGDLGIPVAALEASIGKMNVTASKTPEAFDDIGAAIVRNKDGTINVNETFLATVDALNRIPDASDRAAAAQKIFGRGWKDISELVVSGADGVREAMESVESAKVIDDDEIAKARNFRDTMDELKGVLESVTLTVGGELVSTINEFKDALEGLEGPINTIREAYGQALETPVLAQIIEEAKGALNPLGAAVDKVNELNDILSGGSDEFTFTIRDTAAATGELSDEVQRVADLMGGWDTAPTAAGLEAMGSAMAGAVEGGYDLEAAQKAAQEAAAEHAKELKELEEALTEQADAARGAVDAGFALRDAQRAAEDAAKKVNDVMSDQDATMQDLGRALDDSSKAAIEVADAQVRVAEETATANGRTLTAAQRADTFNNSLLAQAATLEGPARDALLQHVADINQIPDTVATQIQAAIAAGDIAEAERLLAQASRTRETEIQAEVTGASAAEARLNQIARLRTAQINAQIGGATTMGVQLRAGGGRVGVNEPLTMVGEEGPELVSLPAGSMVHTADETASMIGGVGSSVDLGGGGGITVVYSPTINALAASSGEIERVVSQAWMSWLSRNGPGEAVRQLKLA